MSEFKTCPHCDSEINEKAVKCKYCKEWVAEGEEEVSTAEAQREEIPAETKSTNKTKLTLLISFAIVVVVVLLFAFPGTMGMTITLLAIPGFIIALTMLIVNAVMKRPIQKYNVIMLPVCFVMFIVGITVYSVVTDDTDRPVAEPEAKGFTEGSVAEPEPEEEDGGSIWDGISDFLSGSSQEHGTIKSVAESGEPGDRVEIRAVRIFDDPIYTPRRDGYVFTVYDKSELPSIFIMIGVEGDNISSHGTRYKPERGDFVYVRGILRSEAIDDSRQEDWYYYGSTGEVVYVDAYDVKQIDRPTGW